MQNYKTAIGMALFCRCRIRKNQQKPQNYINLDWMIPLPHKNLVVAMQKDSFAVDALSSK
jgi:hydroxymethylbilane synthase